MAIDAAAGDVQWTRQIGNWEYGTPIGIYVVDSRIWVHAHPDEPFALLALSPADGQELQRISTRAVFNSGHHHRCARNKATERFLITSRRGVELTGFSDGSTQVNQWIRGECGYGMMPCNGLFDGRSIYMRQNRFEPVAVEGAETILASSTRHLLATGGLLDDTWFNRIYWALNNQPLGQMFVFDEQSAYGIRSYARPGDVNAHFTPGRGGYRLFAHDYRKSLGRGQTGEKPNSRRKGPPDDRWQVSVPIRAQAFALAGELLFLAGTCDTVDAADPWAAFDGRLGGVLRVVAAEDGEALAEYRLDAPPVYDGLAAVPGRLYCATEDGSIRCFAGE